MAIETEHDLRRRDFFVTRPLGTGHSRPHDVLRTRKALNVTGHAHSPPNPSKIFDPPLIRSLERFQTEWGLKPDTVIEPGGPTEATLELAVKTMREAGPDGIETLRGPIKILNQHGLRFDRAADPRTGTVPWRTREGEPVTMDRVRQLLAEADTSDETEGARRGVQLANALRPRPGEPRWRGGDLPPMYFLGGPPSVPRQKGGAKRAMVPATLIPILLKYLGVSIADDEPDEPKPATPPAPSPNEPAKRTVPMENPPKGSAPFPAEPPRNLKPEREEIKAEEMDPTITVFPIGEERGVGVQIFPDMSDALESWIYVESRGKPDGQQKDTQFVVDYIYKELGRRGIERRHIGGGHHPHSKKYVKERFIHRFDKKVQGGRRPDGTVEVEIDGKNYWIDFNLTDTLADLMTGSKREREALEAIKELKEQWSEQRPEEKGDTIGLPKSKGWDWNEWTAEMERRIDEYLDSKWGLSPR